MHQLKTVDAHNVAEKMEKPDDLSNSITVTELGESVLTLSEVVQTFEVESALFNIRLTGDKENAYRTVSLRKNKVKVEGKDKLVLMIRDVTDTVRFEQELIKKKVDKVGIVLL
jgi:hypothetical protein